MRVTRLFRTAIIVLAASFAAGCGSGSGGSAVDTVSQPVITISTQHSSPETVIYAVELTLHLPDGVTVATDPSTGDLVSGVLQAVDPGGIAEGRYLAATAASKGELRINVVKATGFPIGPIATLKCSASAGADLSSTAFTIDGFSARDANGVVVAGVTPVLSVRMQ